MAGLGDPLSLAFGVVGALFACHLLMQPEPVPVLARPEERFRGRVSVPEGRRQTPSRRAPRRRRRTSGPPEWLSPLLGEEEWPDFRTVQTIKRATTVEPTAEPAAAKATVFGADEKSRRSNHTGIVVRNGRVRIDDWSAWMSFGPETMDLALDAGAKTSGDVLKVLLKRALPEYPWPPRPGSQFEEQWEKLAETVAETLGIPDLPPSGGGGEEEEARPRLHLVQ